MEPSPETVLDELDVGPWRLAVERPADAEALLDEAAFDADEFLPYWAESWPSGLALARLVARRELAGVPVLELGCGLGLPSLAAAHGGAQVVAVDWAPAAIALLQRNAARNGVAVEGVVGDWRDDVLLGERRFPVVLAADVLYEARNVEPVARRLASSIAVGGAALVADPGRRHAAAFRELVRRQGWRRETIAVPELPRGGVLRLWRDRR